jgi:acetyl esterase/lipase
VSANTPPTFIYHTTNDETVPVEGSVRFYLALRSKQVPVELHAFESGRHGSGLGGSNPALAYWPALLQEWLRSRGLLPAPRPGEGRQ